MTSKRAFDLAASASGLGVLIVPGLTLAFTMAVVNRAKPFWTEERIGKDGVAFNVLKITTMNNKRDETGRLLPDKLRTSWLGAVVRKLRMDEWPQLVNVLRGEMSMVGPRPLPTRFAISQDEKRCSVQPGITGPAQLRGTNSMTPEEWLALDHQYIDKHSVLGDLIICLKTPLSLMTNHHIPHFNEAGQIHLSPENRV